MTESPIASADRIELVSDARRHFSRGALTPPSFAEQLDERKHIPLRLYKSSNYRSDSAKEEDLRRVCAKCPICCDLFRHEVGEYVTEQASRYSSPQINAVLNKKNRTVSFRSRAWSTPPLRRVARSTVSGVFLPSSGRYLTRSETRAEPLRNSRGRILLELQHRVLWLRAEMDKLSSRITVSNL